MLFCGNGNKKRGFTVKSMYKAMSTNRYGGSFKHIWAGKITPKIKIFTLFIEKKVTLTKDNMVKRK